MTRIQQTLKHRLKILDFVRGLAIILMFIFHFSFGLNEVGMVNINFSHSLFWVSFRTLIVSTFLILVGIGLVLSKNRDSNQSKTFFQSLASKRLLLLFIYMMLITLFSYNVRPQHYVFFGILHLIFISSLLGRLLINFSSRLLALIALSFILLGLAVDSSNFNHPLVYWLGLGNTPALTDDFAPLFPWFCYVLIGIILGKYLMTINNKNSRIKKWEAQHWYSKLICWGGKNSIHIYFLHFQSFYFMIWFLNFKF